MSTHFDVAVIGGGLVGCAAAFELSQRARRTLVLEQAELNRGASGRNAGSLHFQLEARMIDAVLATPERLAQLIPLNIQAIEDWRQLPARLNCDPELVMHGGLMVAESPAEHRMLLRKLEIEMRGGLAVRIVEGRELARLAPYLAGQIVSAIFCADEGHANPRLITPAYVKAARKHGATFETRARVVSLERSAGSWRVIVNSSGTDAPPTRAELRTIEADSVLIAAGAWARQILSPLGADVPLRAIGLTMSVTERAAPLIGHLVQHVGRRLSIKQVATGNILIGGGWPAILAHRPVLAPEEDAEQSVSSMIGNAAVAVSIVPGIGPLNVIRSWTGIASVTPDHLPVLGAIASLPGIFIAAGGSSFTAGPTYARLIAELMCSGEVSLPIDLYRPDRACPALRCA